MTPRPGRLDEQYFRDVARGCLWILLCAILFGVVVAYLGLGT